jgi:maltose alpha-D-glucosyltransferase/alpha-amylase
MARMIRIRKECPEIGLGQCTVIDVGAEHVLGLRFDWQGNSVITLHNFDEQPHEAFLSMTDDGSRLSDLLAPIEIPATDGCFAIPLESLGYRWFRIGGLDYAVREPRR